MKPLIFTSWFYICTGWVYSWFLLCKQGVGGSIPPSSTLKTPVQKGIFVRNITVVKDF